MGSAAVSRAYTHRTAPLEPGGALMLGGEQVGRRGPVQFRLKQFKSPFTYLTHASLCKLRTIPPSARNEGLFRRLHGPHSRIQRPSG